jgi:hypothetical protein
LQEGETQSSFLWFATHHGHSVPSHLPSSFVLSLPTIERGLVALFITFSFILNQSRRLLSLADSPLPLIICMWCTGSEEQKPLSFRSWCLFLSLGFIVSRNGRFLCKHLGCGSCVFLLGNRTVEDLSIPSGDCFLLFFPDLNQLVLFVVWKARRLSALFF